MGKLGKIPRNILIVCGALLSFWDAAVQMDFMDVMIMYARLFDEADFWLRN